MKLSANNFVVLSNFVCFTSCLIISSLFWSSFWLMSTAQAFSNDKTNINSFLRDDINDYSHSLPTGIHQSLWKVQPRIPPNLMNKIRAKYFNQNHRFLHWISSQKRQMDEQPPPGFLGARGRRNNLVGFENGKRATAADYQTLTEVFPDLWPQLNGVEEPEEAVTEELLQSRLASGKKSDTIVYKDGFLGVRG